MARKKKILKAATGTQSEPKKRIGVRRKRKKKVPACASFVVLLGTGCPGPDPDRSGPAVAIIVHDRPYLIDAGPGVVRRAAAAMQRGVTGLDTHLLDRLFLTHLHSDHTLGVPDVMLTPWVCGRIEPLRVYGPPGTQRMVQHLKYAFEADIDQRLNGLEPASLTGHETVTEEISPGVVYEDELVTVEAFAVDHGTWDAYGYRFRCPDRTIVISGDTCQHDNVVRAAKGCDVLIHEVCSAEGISWRSPDWRNYHSKYHTLGPELAEIANQAQPGLLVLTHQLFQGVSESELLKEIRDHYTGPVVSGQDLDVF